jgi:hypothetical protein
MRGRALLGAALLAACDPVTPPGLLFDVGRGCDDVTLAIADPDVLPGWRLHAAALPDGDGEAAWYLASEAPGELELRRVPEDIPGLDLTSTGQPRQFSLQRGTGEGQVWLTLDRDERAQLWRVDEASATIQAGPLLVDFPADASTRWIRRLVFLGQLPHLIALPQTTRVGEVAVHVAAITPELTLGERSELTAKAGCASLAELDCPLLWDDLRELTVLDVTEPGSMAGAALLLAIATDDAPSGGSGAPPMSAPFETHVLSVTLQRDAGTERLTLTRRDHVAWQTTGPVQPWPAQIAADPLGLYVLLGRIPAANGTSADATPFDYLLRADLLGASSTAEAGVIAMLPAELNSHLLQLGSRVAVGQQADGLWYALPLEGATLNDEDIVGALEIGEASALLRAGRGHVVLVRDDQPSVRVGVACAARRGASPLDAR